MKTIKWAEQAVIKTFGGVPDSGYIINRANDDITETDIKNLKLFRFGDSVKEYAKKTYESPEQAKGMCVYDICRPDWYQWTDELTEYYENEYETDDRMKKIYGTPEKYVGVMKSYYENKNQRSIHIVIVGEAGDAITEIQLVKMTVKFELRGWDYDMDLS